MCRLLRVSRSGYCARVKRHPSPRAVRDAQLTEALLECHARSDGTYGAPCILPRILLDLRAGEHVGRKRVARLMREAGAVGVHRRRGMRTAKRCPDEMAATDLLKCNFTVCAPGELWLADITYVPTWAGFLYLAVVLDASHSNRSAQTAALAIRFSRRHPRFRVMTSSAGVST